MSEGLIDQIRHVVANWNDDVMDTARELEGRLALAVADAFVDALLEHDTVTSALEDSALSPAEEELRAVHTMEAEVMNGGFVQFFDNCGHEEVRLAQKGCERIGAPHFSVVVAAALELVESDPDDEWPEELTTALDAVDERFYDAYLEVEELLKLRLKYAATHPEEFKALR